MRVAIIATYTHPTRLACKERSVMQSAVPELIAGLCPPHAEIELYNEKEGDVPLDRDWDLVFFSYLHAYYEHTKVLSAKLRRRGVKTVAGGRHATHFPDDCAAHFDAVVTGDPEVNVPELVADFERGNLKGRYDRRAEGPLEVRPYRYDLIDYRHNVFRLPGIEASRGCPFSCNFCVLTGWEQYRYRPVAEVIREIRERMTWNRNLFGALADGFMFLDNNLGGSPRYLRDLCTALLPLGKIWGCAVTFNVLRDPELVRLMGRAGCRYVYTGLESLDAESLAAMNKGQNKLKEVNQVIERCFASGILLSFGLLVGSDGDTNEYLQRLPQYLADLKYFSVTFLGIVCPYPETGFFRTVAREGRLLPGVVSRDLDGYTLCHRPARLSPSEAIEHWRRLCVELGSLANVFRHYRERLGASSLRRYRSVIVASGLEILSIGGPVRNPRRRYIAGLDDLEAEDVRDMAALGLRPQPITADLADADGALPRVRLPARGRALPPATGHG
jgi:radical SAM superfamily enzyme YgiQ (UPF0313 family)